MRYSVFLFGPDGMSFPGIATQLLKARKPYPDRPWQRWLGLSQGGPRFRLEYGEKVWWLYTAFPLLVYATALGLIALVSLLTPVSKAFFLDWEPIPYLLGAALFIVHVGYALLVSLSAGHLQEKQLLSFEQHLARWPCMALACSDWMQQDDILRTRDLWRLRIVGVLLRAKEIEMDKKEQLNAFWQHVVDQRSAPAPLPATLEPAERAKVEAVLSKLSKPTPMRTNFVHRCLGRVCSMLDYGFPWVMLSRPTRKWQALALASLALQMVLAVWLIAPVIDLTGKREVGGMVSAMLGVAFANAFWFGLPRLRLRPSRILRETLEDQAQKSPLVAWVLAQRCPDPDRASTRDMVMAIRAGGLLAAHETRLRDDLVRKAYLEQIDQLPTIGASRAQAVAEALDEATPESPRASAPPRRL